MSWMFYLVAAVMLVSVFRLLRAPHLLFALRELCIVALGMLVLSMMLDSYTAAISYVLLYGMGLLVSCFVILWSITQQKTENAELSNHDSLNKKSWFLPSILGTTLLFVILYFIFQATGSFTVNELSSRMVAKTLWQNYTVVMVAVLFWLVVVIMLMAQMLAFFESELIKPNLLNTEPQNRRVKDNEMDEDNTADINTSRDTHMGEVQS